MNTAVSPFRCLAQCLSSVLTHYCGDSSSQMAASFCSCSWRVPREGALALIGSVTGHKSQVTSA
eukprot:scaffold138187_cov33-Tisochrysis_lutea.AAC.1